MKNKLSWKCPEVENMEYFDDVVKSCFVVVMDGLYNGKHYKLILEDICMMAAAWGYNKALKDNV